MPVGTEHRNVIGRSPGNKVEKAQLGLTMKRLERYPVCLGDLLDYKTLEVLVEIEVCNPLPGMGPRELEFNSRPS